MRTTRKKKHPQHINRGRSSSLITSRMRHLVCVSPQMSVHLSKHVSMYVMYACIYALDDVACLWLSGCCSVICCATHHCRRPRHAITYCPLAPIPTTLMLETRTHTTCLSKCHTTCQKSTHTHTFIPSPHRDKKCTRGQRIKYLQTLIPFIRDARRPTVRIVYTPACVPVLRSCRDDGRADFGPAPMRVRMRGCARA